MPADRTVVLVHGLWYGPVSLGLLALRLGVQHLTCHRFGYPTLRQSVGANAEHLAAFIRDLDTDQVDVVGHSLGGLVALNLFEDHSDLPPGRLVLLGSPTRGSSVADRIVDLRPVRPLIGQARSALRRSYRRAPEGRTTGVVAGTRGLGLGRVVHDLERPNDGTIAVSETRLAGVADRLELPVSHTGLVLSRTVADAVARFLHQGRFVRES
jgi:pimeloyl-ACP methyl ester carboxylesterase